MLNFQSFTGKNFSHKIIKYCSDKFKIKIIHALTLIVISSPPTICSNGNLLESAKQNQTAELIYSTFLGGSNIEVGKAIAVDEIGNIYITGQTNSDDFPVTAVSDQYKGGLLGLDIFAAKFDPDGVLIYNIYIGGSGDEIANDIKVDQLGRAYIVGSSTSSNLPGSMNAIQQYQGGSILFTDAFFLILSADGSTVEYATYLGGTDDDGASNLAIGNGGSVYIAGTTNSSNFPTTQGVFQPAISDTVNNLDTFILRLDSDGSGGYNIVYSTYLGGSRDDTPTGIAVDQNGSVVVTGFTNSSNFPIQNSIQNNFAGPLRPGEGDIYITSLNSTGNALNFSSYFGGSQDDRSVDIIIDNSESIYFTGWTNSADFPTTVGVYQSERQGFRDRFIAKLINSSGSYFIEYSTRFGSSGIEFGAAGIAIDQGGGIWIGGSTNSDMLPLINADYPIYSGGETDAFIARLDSNGSGLTYATYFGGFYADVISDLSLGVNTINIIGSTGSPNLPILNAHQQIFDGPISEDNITTSIFTASFQISSIVDLKNELQLPHSFSLYQNYPNPFNPQTTIRFDVKEKTKVNVTIYDILGSRVLVLVNSEYNPGQHQINFNADKLASGIYFYKIRMGNFSDVKKMVLLK